MGQWGFLKFWAVPPTPYPISWSGGQFQALCTPTHDPLMKPSGPGGEAEWWYTGREACMWEVVKGSTFLKACNSGLKIDSLGAQKLKPVVTCTCVQSLTFCPGEGSNMLTFKLSQLSLIDTARASTEPVTVVPRFHFPLIHVRSLFSCFHLWLPWCACTKIQR